MTGHHPFSELRKRMTPERRLRNLEATKRVLASSKSARLRPLRATAVISVPGTLILLLPMLASAADKINFNSDKRGEVPPGWTVAMTHSGVAPKWEVVADPTGPSKGNVLAQTSKSQDYSDRYPLLIYDNSNLKDGEVGVAFKTLSGMIDQTAGVVWRYKEADNYYVARAQGLGDNVILWKVDKGRRIPLVPKGLPSYSVSHYVSNYVWHTLRVTFSGQLFTVYMDGEKLFDLEDATFKDAGKVGIWTKADSVIYFDSFEFK